MKLTEQQEQAVRKWAQDGCGLSEIQKKLSEEFKISATYMDVRFLAIDLGLEIQEKKKAAASVAGPSRASSGADDMQEETPEMPEDVPADGHAASTGVTVALDRVMKAGSVVSGTVKFSDGVSASWFVDQYGQLALDAGRPGYSPRRQDLEAFQKALRKEFEKRGF
jgi:hypothetical protein